MHARARCSNVVFNARMWCVIREYSSCLEEKFLGSLLQEGALLENGLQNVNTCLWRHCCIEFGRCSSYSSSDLSDLCHYCDIFSPGNYWEHCWEGSQHWNSCISMELIHEFSCVQITFFIGKLLGASPVVVIGACTLNIQCVALPFVCVLCSDSRHIAAATIDIVSREREEGRRLQIPPTPSTHPLFLFASFSRFSVISFNCSV